MISVFLELEMLFACVMLAASMAALMAVVGFVIMTARAPIRAVKLDDVAYDNHSLDPSMMFRSRSVSPFRSPHRNTFPGMKQRVVDDLS